MFFIKKLILGLAAVILIYVGGNGTQSSNLLFQGGGFVGMIVGFVVLYIFAKMVWRAMGCLPVLLIICLIVGFILYAIGAFNNGVENVVPNVLNFLGAGRHTAAGSAVQANASAEPAVPEIVESSPAVPLLNENFDEVSPVVPEAAGSRTDVGSAGGSTGGASGTATDRIGKRVGASFKQSDRKIRRTGSTTFV